jgi:hypothetical protein
MRCWDRFNRTGRWGFDGPALLDLPSTIDLHEQLISLSTPIQMADAMKEAIRRMDTGEYLK